VNGPKNVVLSGETAALEAALKDLDARGVTHRMLPVEYAFHSAQMAPFQARLAERLGNVQTTPAAISFYSTVTGGVATKERIDAAYFGRNVRERVRFASALGAMAADGFDVFLEIGPHPVLASAITESVEAAGKTASVVASLRRSRPERETMLRACAGLYEAGVVPAWDAFQEAFGQVVSLPAYPWQRKRYWIRSRPNAPATRGTSTGHPILGHRASVAGERVRIYEASSEGAPAWLADHRIFDRLVVPAAAVLDAFAVAAADALGRPALVSAFAIDRPLFLPESDVSRWQIVVHVAGARVELELHDQAGGTWRKIASATAEASAGEAAPMAFVGRESITTESVYVRFAALGVAFGPAFRRLSNVRRDPGGMAEAWIDGSGLDSLAGGRSLHPTLIDAALQLCSVAATRGPEGELPATVVLPLGVDRYEVTPAAHARLLARARVRASGASLLADVTIDAPNGERVATLDGVRFARADASVFATHDEDDGVYDVVWQRAEPVRAAAASGAWLLFVDRGGCGDALAKEIAAAGGTCARVHAGKEYARTTDGWIVDPSNAEDLRRIFAEGGWSKTSPLRGVVHLWNLDLAAAATTVDEDALGTGSLLHLAQHLVRAMAGERTSLVVVTRGAQSIGGEAGAWLRPRAAGAWGLASVIALEHPEVHVRRIDLGPNDDRGLFSEVIASSDATTSAALRDGTRWTERLERHRSSRATPSGPEATPLRLDLVRPGTLDGIELRTHARAELEADEVRLRVLASGINFRDVLLTLGAYAASGVPLGAECVGVVTEVGRDVTDFRVGARVFGFAPGSLATEVTVPAAFLAEVPSTLKSEDAAGMPVAFLTAYYGLYELARIRAGERVLIHAATGGVGLAAVQLAQAAGAEIFATAGSEDKRALLRSLGVAHVMDSRSLAFADEVHALTKGEGVDVVLNSLAGDFIPASLRALAKGGRFLELGKREIMTKDSAAKARPDVSYWAYDLGSDAEANRALLRPMFTALQGALSAGKIRPLPVTVYALEDAAEAFRFMAQAKHVGKIVAVPRAGRAIAKGDATYWITGGLGALGLETARWLVRSGAKSLVLTGRHAPNEAASKAIHELESDGAAIRVLQADVADRDAMAAVLTAIDNELPPLRGVIHAAGVVRDAPLLDQTWTACREVLSSKAHGAFVLHELTRDRSLDFFVLYSAAGVFLGAPGQGAYPAANAELDALARTRRALGLPALSIAWGAWDTGMARTLGRDVWAERGLVKLSAATAFPQLERLLREDIAYAAIAPMRWGTFLERLSPGVDRTFFRAVAKESAPAAPEATRGSEIVDRLRKMPAGQRREALTLHVIDKTMQVLALDAATTIDPKVPLKAVGLDSLMAVELRNLLARSLEQPLPPTLLFDYPTVEALTAFLARLLELEDAPKTEQRPPKPMVDDVAELSDEEAEALLLQELGDDAPRAGRKEAP
jgi:NADPH:quinone reductase-like Zn-dependent oxidoreductase/NADP-dependent 3-hydroxy acid dehydrogenase YdfG